MSMAILILATASLVMAAPAIAAADLGTEDAVCGGTIPELCQISISGDGLASRLILTGDGADESAYETGYVESDADDVIITSGYRIGPFEVESALLEHDAVAESAVVSSPDSVRGEIVKAFVVLKPGREPSGTGHPGSCAREGLHPSRRTVGVRLVRGHPSL